MAGRDSLNPSSMLLQSSVLSYRFPAFEYKLDGVLERLCISEQPSGKRRSPSMFDCLLVLFAQSLQLLFPDCLDSHVHMGPTLHTYDPYELLVLLTELVPASGLPFRIIRLSNRLIH